MAGFQTVSSMPLRMPWTTRGARAQQAVERHAERRRHDLARVGRRDGGDAVGELQAGLQVADAADNIRPRRSSSAAAGKPSSAKIEAGKWPWKAMLWIGDHRARARAIGIVQIGGSERRLPVMRVDDLRQEAADRAEPDVGADASERGEAARVVRPIEPVGAEVGIAGPGVEMRRVEHEQVEPRGPAGEDAGRRRRTDRCSRATVGSAGELGQDRRDSRGPACCIATPSRASAAGSAPATSASPPVLIERKDLRGDGEDLQRRSLRELVDHRLGDQA